MVVLHDIAIYKTPTVPIYNGMQPFQLSQLKSQPAYKKQLKRGDAVLAVFTIDFHERTGMVEPRQIDRFMSFTAESIIVLQENKDTLNAEMAVGMIRCPFPIDPLVSVKAIMNAANVIWCVR